MDFAAPKLVQLSENSYAVTHGDDRGIFAEFFMDSEYQEFESQKEGRPIYKDIPFINIIFPADRTKKITRKVKLVDDESSPSDPHRFPKQWAAFQAQQEQVPDGSPIEMWPPLTKSRIRELKALHLHTVEQIASISDQNGPEIGIDWRKLRDQARAYLDSAQAGSIVSKLQAENDAMKTDIEMLRQQIASLGASSKEETAAPRRGRPPSTNT